MRIVRRWIFVFIFIGTILLMPDGGNRDILFGLPRGKKKGHGTKTTRQRFAYTGASGGIIPKQTFTSYGG
ncbi:hypothetical protein FAZ19_19270 [Sphingobacterium alkalisoli]|uniref:Uncharacterized protein n=1 Tax=Sphingobacterium alkalisoli TaxID=1874115 RepID=A0A4U0GU77_9SPHI|nr:hypothetical protein [Sphingobacterium alkalisoli]TJY62615.1 hypothetical protein FAZ19_19270 [Sphingobacterium alkalisoli]